MPRTGAATEVPGRMAADHCVQLSRTDLSECLWQLFGAADFQPTTWGTQGLAPVSAGQLTEPISPVPSIYLVRGMPQFIS